MKILLIRHGDPDYEKDSLTEKGWHEAELLAQRRELDAKIEAMRKEEQATAIAKIREMVEAYELSAADVFPSGRGAKVRATDQPPEPEANRPCPTACGGQGATAGSSPPRPPHGSHRSTASSTARSRPSRPEGW